jgi:hypothetical protein
MCLPHLSEIYEGVTFYGPVIQSIYTEVNLTHKSEYSASVVSPISGHLERISSQ